MYIKLNKRKDIKSQTLANSIAYKRSTRKQDSKFFNNRQDTIQRKFTYKRVTYNNENKDALDNVSLPHRVKKNDAKELAQSNYDYEVLTDKNSFDAAIKKMKDDNASKPTIIEPMKFDHLLISKPNIEVGMDSHQNKHQILQLPEFPPYTGGKAQGTFDNKIDMKWHIANTAPIAEAWALEIHEKGLLSPAGTMYHSKTGEDLGNNDIGFVASAMVDTKGKIYCNYHCYPI